MSNQAHTRRVALVLAALALPLSAAGCERLDALRRVPRTVVLDASAGLRVGDEVRIAGVAQGAVTTLAHRHAEAVVTIHVDPAAPLFVGTCGIVAPKSSFGPRHLILKPGPLDAGALPADAQIPRCGGALDLPEMLNQFAPILSDTEAPTWEQNARSLKTVNGLLGLVIGDEYKSPDVQKSVDQADSRTKEILEWLREAVAPVREFVGDAEEVLTHELLDAGVAELEARLGKLDEELPETFRALEADLDALDDRLEGLLSDESRANRDQVLADAIQALADIQKVIDKYEPIGAEAAKTLDEVHDLTKRGLEIDANYFRRYQAEGYRSYMGPIPKEAREALDKAGVKYETRGWDD